MKNSALLIIDVQNDFCPGGALAVPEGDQVIPVLNELLRLWEKEGGLIVASRDWHPADSRHFQDQGGAWPVHCVQNTPGADFHPELALPSSAIVISKGMDVTADGYSAFEGHDDQGRSLESLLKDRAVKEVVVGGLATDYCVKASVIDACRRGFAVKVVVEAIRAVDVHLGDGEKALQAMREAGAEIVSADQWLSPETQR